MYTIIGKIDNFDRKKSYKGFERTAPVQAVKVNKCITTKVVRKKRGANTELIAAKREWKQSRLVAN